MCLLCFDYSIFNYGQCWHCCRNVRISGNTEVAARSNAPTCPLIFYNPQTDCYTDLLSYTPWGGSEEGRRVGGLGEQWGKCLFEGGLGGFFWRIFLYLDLPFFNYCSIREPPKKNIRDFLGVFPKCRTPPPPYLGGLRPKKFKGLFCVLGPKEHFFFSFFLHLWNIY